MNVGLERTAGRFDAIAVLCGGLIKHELSGRYLPTDYCHSDQFGMLGGKTRVIAAIRGYFKGLSNRFIFSTGVSEKSKVQFSPTIPPPEAMVYAALFMNVIEKVKRRTHYPKLKDLPNPEITLETASQNTFTNLQRICEIIAEHQNWNRVMILTSDYHIPRAMLQHELLISPDYPDWPSDRITFQSAEKFLEDAAPGKYTKIIDQAYASRAAALRKQNEAQGMAALIAGSSPSQEYRIFG